MDMKSAGMSSYRVMIRGVPVRTSLGHEDDDLVSCLIEDELQGSSVRKGIRSCSGSPGPTRKATAAGNAQ